jgi:hypothetical protein
VSTGIADVIIRNQEGPEPIVSGGESVSLLIYSAEQAVQLPVISAAYLSELGTPVEGQLAFLEDSLAIIYFDGLEWKKLQHDPALFFSALLPPDEFGTLSMNGGDIHASTLLSLGEGLVNLPVFSTESILDIANLTPGMVVYDSSTGKVRCYNGNEWQALTDASTTLEVSADPASLVPGIAINQDYKHPSSVMDINPTPGKAFLLPKLNPEQIYSPVAGLICYSPSANRLIFYNGVNWSVLK